jgi:hypothetical protein
VLDEVLDNMVKEFALVVEVLEELEEIMEEDDVVCPDGGAERVLLAVLVLR